MARLFATVPHRRLFADITPLRTLDFRRLWLAGIVTMIGGNLTVFASQDGGEGGTGQEVAAAAAGAADVATAIWLQVAEWGILAFESAAGGVECVVFDPSTLV